MLFILRRNLFSKRISSLFPEIRTFLSDAYNCQSVWEERKKAPIFKKIDYEDFYHQLDRSFQMGHRISVLDVDLFVNSIDSEHNENELEDVLLRLRLNPECGLLGERTMHAVIKFYMNIGKKKELINILSNRLTYGIFPDYYASNMLINSFLKEGEYVCAVKVAVLQMLQEDFNHPILRALSLYSCYKYLNSPEVWVPPKKLEVDPDEDEVKVRVPFLRNPYFDDHFDLVDTNHLVGKTLHMAGLSHLGPLGISSQLVGLTLFDKLKAAKDVISDVIENKEPIYDDALNKAINYAKDKPKKESETSNVEDTEEVKTGKADFISVLEKVKTAGNVIPGDMETVAAAEVSNIVSRYEAEDIKSLKKLYKDWEREREDHVQYEILESQKRKAVVNMKKIKEDLMKEEEMIFFFDKEDEWDLKVQEKEREILSFNKEQEKYKKKKVEEDYIPPEIDRKHS